MNGNKFIDEASLETTNFDYSLVQTKGFACLGMQNDDHRHYYSSTIHHFSHQNPLLAKFHSADPNSTPMIDLTHKHIETGNFSKPPTLTQNYHGGQLKEQFRLAYQSTLAMAAAEAGI